MERSKCCGAEMIASGDLSHEVCFKCGEPVSPTQPEIAEATKGDEPTPKQDGQTIDELVDQVILWTIDSQMGKSAHEIKYLHPNQAKAAIEAYCAERERLARIDEIRTHMSNLPDVDSTEVWLRTRLQLLQQQSSSQEAND